METFSNVSTIVVFTKILVLAMALAVSAGGVQENNQTDAKAIQFFREIEQAYQNDPHLGSNICVKAETLV